MSDEELVRWLVEWGVTPHTLFILLMLIVLAATIRLNIYLWRQFKKVRSDGDAAAEDATSVMDWSQNASEIEIDFPLPTDKVTNRSDVLFKITSFTIYFAFRGDDSPMLEGTLHQPVLCDECTWQFWPVGAPTHVKLLLTKCAPGTWPAVLSKDATGRLQQDAIDGDSTSAERRATKQD